MAWWEVAYVITAVIALVLTAGWVDACVRKRPAKTYNETFYDPY